MKNRKLAFPLAIFLLAGTSAQAQTWSSTTGGNWTNGSNWSTTPTAPVNDGTANITFNTAPGTLTSAIDTAYSINSLTFGSSSGNWAISGSALTIGAGGIVNNLSATTATTISAPVTIGASQTWDTGSAAGNTRFVTLSGAITGTSDKTITVSGAQGLTNYRAFFLSNNNAATLASNFIVGAGGRLVNGVNTTNGLGTGTITINTGGLVGGANGGSNWANNMTLAGGAIGAMGDGGGGLHNGNLAINSASFVNMTRGSDGVIIGGGASSLISGSGNLTQNIDSGTTTKTTYIGNTGSSVNNTNTGTLTINTGQVQLQKADNTVAWGGNIVINSGGVLKYNSVRENQIGDTATVTINTGGSLNLSHDNAQQLHEKIASLVVNAPTSAFINDTSLAGTARIIVGSGTSATGTGGIFVTSGGSLSGGGTVNKLTTIDGGNFSVGDGGVGALTFSQTLSLTSLAAASLKFELGADTSAGVSYDTVNLASAINLNIGSGLIEFDRFQFTNLAGFAPGIYTLFNSDNAITGALGANLSGLIAGYSSTLSFANSNQDIILTVIPEPNVAMLLGGLGMFALVRRRRN